MMIKTLLLVALIFTASAVTPVLGAKVPDAVLVGKSAVHWARETAISWIKHWSKWSDAEWGEYCAGQCGYTADEWTEYFSTFSVISWYSWQLNWLLERVMGTVRRGIFFQHVGQAVRSSNTRSRI